jgi:hypothetical protein
LTDFAFCLRAFAGMESSDIAPSGTPIPGDSALHGFDPGA